MWVCPEQGREIRPYRTMDCRTLMELFRDTVHTVNARDYTLQQRNAWAPAELDPEEWERSLSNHITLVAWEGEKIVGFADGDRDGHLDRLFVHKDHQRQGIASALCGALEEILPASVITTEASITAKAFFAARGYRSIRGQQVERRGVLLCNYVMCKEKI
mgnify:FL=1